MKKHLLLYLFALVSLAASAQQRRQYFDGADTSSFSSIFIERDNSAGNLWQIGRPGKMIFDSAYSTPNVLVTDTLSNCPAGNISRFYFRYSSFIPYGIVALQWAQKLDLEPGVDGAMIDYSKDGGTTWESAFNNPYVYNFYGFSESNKDTLPDGAVGFSGQDTLWKDIWLCFEGSWLHANDTVLFRFSLITDSIAHNREGWMIDNLMIRRTYVHTINETKQLKYFDIYPNPADKRVYIRGEKLNQFHIIEDMQLVTVQGTVWKQWKNVPLKFYFDTGDIASGVYYLRIKTNLKTQTFPIVIRHE